MRLSLTGDTGFLGRAIIPALMQRRMAAQTITAPMRHPPSLLQSWGGRQRIRSILAPSTMDKTFNVADQVFQLTGMVSGDPEMAHTLHGVHITGT